MSSVWRDALIQLVAQGIIAKLEGRMHKEEPLLAPPTSLKTNQFIPLKRIFLPPTAHGVLVKFADAIDQSPEATAEIILQGFLHSVPILEAMSDSAVSMENLAQRIADTLVIETKLKKKRTRRIKN